MNGTCRKPARTGECQTRPSDVPVGVGGMRGEVCTCSDLTSVSIVPDIKGIDFSCPNAILPVQHDSSSVFSRLSFLVRLAALTGLIAVTAACGSSSSVTEPNGEIEELRTENAELREKLQEARTEAASLQRGETIKVLSTDVYFRSGSADLTEKGIEELQKVAQRIRRKYPDRTIRVEGYTDSKPIGDKLKEKYPSNWELSAARAARVVRHFQWTHDMDPKRFEVVGFGSYHPVASNETAEGRRKNRRVRVAVLSESPDAGPPAK